MINTTCNPNSFSNHTPDPFEQRKKPYNPDELTDIELRALNMANRLRANAPRIDDLNKARLAETARMQQYSDEVFSRNVGQLFHLNPKARDGVGNFLYNYLGLKQKALGLNPSKAYSTTGEVGQNMRNYSRVAEGMIDKVARFSGAQKVSEVVKDIKGLFKERGIIVSHEKLGDLIDNAIEVGQIPARRSVYMTNSAADVFNMKRYDKFVDEMSSLGLTKQDIDDIVNKTQDISNVMAETHALYKAVGGDVGMVDGIGYLHRVMTPDAQAWFDASENLNKLADVLGGKPSTAEVKSMFDKARQTFHWVVEDEALLGHMLGKTPEELSEILSDGRVLTSYMNKELSKVQQDALVDLGYVSKVPMSTPEVWDYMIKQYPDMPFKSMEDLWVRDPVNIVDHYTNSLKRAAGESGLVRGIFKDGIKEGWAVTKQEKLANPELFKDFIEVTGDKIKQYYADFPSNVEHMYLHPIVANTWSAQMDLATDPNKLAMLGYLFKYVGRVSTQGLLMVPQYSLRILYSAISAMSAGGGNVFRYPEALKDIATLHSKGWEALDNVAKNYKIGDKLYTKREMMEQFILHRNRDILPQTPGMQSGTFKIASFNRANPLNLGKELSFMGAFGRTFGWDKAMVHGLENFRAAQAEVFQPFGFAAQFFEASGKFNLMLSRADVRPSSAVGKFVGGLGNVQATVSSHANFEDLFRHVDEYFYPFDDMGKAAKAIGTYIRPFAAFSMYNTPAVIRHVMRNPQQFMNYARVRSVINVGASSDEEFTEAQVPQFVQDGGPLYMFKDKKTGQWVPMMTNSWDPYNDAIQGLDGNFKDIAAATMGWYSGSSADQRNQLEKQQKPTKWLTDLSKETVPAIRLALAGLSGRDPDTGAELDAGRLATQPQFLGVRMPRLLSYVLKAYPPLDSIDRFNPGEVFGTPDIIDSRTGRPKVDPVSGYVHAGRLSWAGYARTRKMMDDYGPRQKELGINVMRAMGTNVKLLDTAAQLQLSYDEIDRMGNDFKKQMSQAAKSMTANYMDDKERDRKKSEMSYMADAWMQLEIDKQRIKVKMEKDNVPSTELLRAVEKLKTGDMPQLDDEILMQTLSEYVKYKSLGDK